MAKRGRSKNAQPDEEFNIGPLNAARYGDKIFFQTHWPEHDFAEMQKKLVEDLPKVIEHIDLIVNEIADRVRTLPPEKVLHRAWGERTVKHLHVKADVEVEDSHALSMRMVDYIQSIIASVPPAADQLTEIDDQAWETLTKRVNDLFKTINSDYQICRRPASIAKDPEFDESFEEFQFRAQLYWCNVRGNRYQVHEPAYLRDVFQPHSQVIHELFGFSANDFIDELGSGPINCFERLGSM